MYLITEMDTEVILDHIEMDTEVIKLIHVDKELLYSQDDHENYDHLDMKLILD